MNTAEQTQPAWTVQPAWTGDQIRQAEQPLLEAGEGPGLMRRAAYGLAQHLSELLQPGVYGRKVAGLIGSGNNGGDGLYALAWLRRRGVEVQAVLTRGRAHEQALAAFTAAGGKITEEIDDDVDIVVDAVLGTGFTGDYQAPQLPVAPLVVACDVPSGVDASTGAVRGTAIRADHTVTFGGMKTGLLAGEGGYHSGRIHTVDIGVSAHLPEAAAFWLQPQEAVQRSAPATDTGVTLGRRGPDPAMHKYSRGTVHLVAGSAQYPGAAQLTAAAAVTTGVGMVTLCAPESVRAQVLSRCPEVVGGSAAHGSTTEGEQDLVGEFLARAAAVVVGPGIGEDLEQLRAATEAIRHAGHTGTPCVVDASAVQLVAGPLREQRSLGPHVVLTPHLGEMRRVLEETGQHSLREALSTDPVRTTQQAAETWGVTVLLKGATTVLAAPGCTPILHRAQTPGLATAGSGDVLAGMLGSLLATQMELPGKEDKEDKEAAQADTTQTEATQQIQRVAALAVALHAETARRLDPHGSGCFGASALTHTALTHTELSCAAPTRTPVSRPGGGVVGFGSVARRDPTRSIELNP